MRLFAAGCALALAAAAVGAQPEAPARTLTPVHRLSGGFGRPRATPPPPADGGQSLADVVRAAKEARQQGENPTRERSGLTIDNRSLVTNPDKGRVSTSRVAPAREHPPAASVPSAPRNAPAEATPAAATSASAAPSASEAEWREIARAARKRAADAKARVGELEAAVKKLENDFYAWDDGQYRDRVIKPAWDKTRDQLEDARRELAAAEKDVTDLPEKARRAGAMPGWIRE